MRLRTAIPAITAVLLTAACSSTAHSTPASSSAPATTASSPAAAPSAGGNASASTLSWGTQVFTVGSEHPFQSSATPGAPLQITPETIVYASHAPAETPASGMFVIVVTKDQAPQAAAVATAPATGGGWTWIAPDGQATTTMNGNANMVVLTGLTGDVAPAGAYVDASVVFDVPASAKGGTLQYTDGSGETFRWKTPAANTGPQVGQVTSALKQ